MKTWQFLMTAGLMSAALASPAQAAVEAYTLYQDKCAKCHGETGQANNWRGYLFFARNFKNKDWQERMSDARILEEINQGPRIMPSFEKTLTEDEKAALIRVIRQFGR
jgi:mono/diheme cytochrome c family protein